MKASSYRVGDDCVCERCSDCGEVKEEYTDEEIGIFLIILGTFIHREPSLAALFLPDILAIVSKTSAKEILQEYCPVQLLVENLNSKKTLPGDVLPIILRNLSEYLPCVAIDSLGANAWTTTIQGVDTLFRRIILILNSLDEAENLIYIMISLLKVPGISKSVLDPFSKILSYVVQNLTIKHKMILDLCYNNSRAFSKDRDKLQLCRPAMADFHTLSKIKNFKNGALVTGLSEDTLGGVLKGAVAQYLALEMSRGNS